MKPLSDHPYASFLHLVRTPSRYVGGEFGSCVKDPARTAGSIALVFPDVYEVGMSHLGSHILYEVIAREPDLRLERCFAPWPDLEAELRARRLPLVTLENFLPLRTFDVVGFSLQHELSYTNVLNVLDLSGIPLRAEDRTREDPIVLGGGPCATRPAPVAPFFDAFFVGEAEEDLADLVRTVSEHRRRKAPRDEVLRALSTRPGVLVPSLHAWTVDPLTGFRVPEAEAPRVQRRIVMDLDRVPIPVAAPLPWSRVVFDRASIEIARGCTEGCRFCEAGYTYRPLRERSAARMVPEVLARVEQSGLDEVSLCALSPADLPGLEAIVQALSRSLTPRGVTLSVSSLRAYGVSEAVLRELRRVRAAGLTLAPEAGSEALRDVINKNVTDEDLLAAVARAFEAGWQRVKLYFMIGLPTETDDDVRAIARLARRVLEVGRSRTRRARVTASVGVFVPRPHTPFQWEGMAPDEVLARREEVLLQELRGSGVDWKVADRWLARLECVMARGDARVADAIETAFRLGCRFDNWDDLVRKDLWAEAFARTGLDPERYQRAWPLQARLPWDGVDVRVHREFLLRERERAFRGRALPPCEKPSTPRRRPTPEDYESARTVLCYRCGAPCEPKATAAQRARVVREAREFMRVPDEPRAGAEREAARPARAGETEATSHWLLVFAKIGRAAWLSQKDLVAHLPRILRRAGLDLLLSHGFHPLPRLSYRPPLPVGYQGIAEWVVASLSSAQTGAPDLSALNRASVEGIVFRCVRRLESRRFHAGPAPFAFRSALEPDQWPAILPAGLSVRLAPDDLDPLAAEVLDPRRGPFLYLLDWPPAARIEGQPHRVLSDATGTPYTPPDFVRLADDPALDGIQEQR